MNTRSIIDFILKALAIYVLIQFIQMLPALISMIQMYASVLGAPMNDLSTFGNMYLTMSIYLSVVSLFYLALAGSLFFKSHKLAGLLVKNGSEQVNISGKVSQQVVMLAFQCMGIYAFVTWAPNLIQILCRTLIYSRMTVPQPPLLRSLFDNWSHLIAPATGTLLGLLLLFKTNGLLRLAKRSQPTSEESAQPESE